MGKTAGTYSLQKTYRRNAWHITFAFVIYQYKVSKKKKTIYLKQIVVCGLVFEKTLERNFIEKIFCIS